MQSILKRCIRLLALWAALAGAWPAFAQTLYYPNSAVGTIGTVNPPFRWAAIPGALSYNLLVQNTAGVAIYENHEANAALCKFSGFLGPATCETISDTPLADSAAYNWFIQPVTASGAGPWYGPLAFSVNRTQTPPGAVTVIAPALRPNSALVLFVTTWNSAIASGGGCNT